MTETAAYRDRAADLYVKCRCDDIEAFALLKNLALSSSHPSFEDELVFKGYLGDALLSCQTCLIPFDESRGKELLSLLLELNKSELVCSHLRYLLAVYHHHCTGNMDEEVELFQLAANDNMIATLVLGYCYDTGHGVRKRR